MDVKLIEFSTREEAEAFAAKCDAALGYPAVGDTCQAIHVGEGPHATHPLCCTTRYAEVREGKTGFAVPVGDVSRALKGEVADALATKAEIEPATFALKADPPTGPVAIEKEGDSRVGVETTKETP